MAEVMVAGATGGREHAMGLSLAASGASHITFTHGGNAGTRELGMNLPERDSAAIARYAAERVMDLVVIGPEAPLVDGLADMLRAQGVPAFGPGVAGAQLEASKAFSALFNSRFGIPQPNYVVTDNEADVDNYIRANKPEGMVIKADGLAAGKGAILPHSRDEALKTAYGMLSGKLFGKAGEVILFQQRLERAPKLGEELSAFFILDGKSFALLDLAQDFKRAGDGDTGPNTGGMGAYAPLPFAAPELIDEVMGIGQRAAEGLQKLGIDYRGVLYSGLMRDASNDGKLKVIEYNVRFGDPETQVVLARLAMAGIDFYSLVESAAKGSLDDSVKGRYLGAALGGAAVTVCLATEGYPDSEKVAANTGKAISGLSGEYAGVTIHHGSTKYDEKTGRVLSSGGRVLYVTAMGSNVAKAHGRAYGSIGEDGVWFEGAQCRTDIAARAATTAR